MTEFLGSSDDTALVQLAEPVRDVAPARIYTGSALGEAVRIVGRGATGTGPDGHDPHDPNRTDLRRGEHLIGSSEGRWIAYTSDPPPSALPLEVSVGNGDSGGPILIDEGGERNVAGLTSWKRTDVGVAKFCPGKYGQTN